MSITLRSSKDIVEQYPHKRAVLWWHWLIWIFILFAMILSLYTYYQNQQGQDHFLHLSANDVSRFDPYLDDRYTLSIFEYDGVVIDFDEVRHEPYIQGTWAGNYNIMFYNQSEYKGEVYFEIPADNRGIVQCSEQAINDGYNKVVFVPVSGKSFWFSFIDPLQKAEDSNIFSYEPRIFKASYLGGENHEIYDQTYVNGVYAYFVSSDENVMTLKIANVANNWNIELIAIENATGDQIAVFENSLLPAVDPEDENSVKIMDYGTPLVASSYNLNDLYVSYHYSGKSEMKRSKVNPFMPENEEVYQSTQIRTMDNMNEFEQIEIENGIVFFNADTVVLKSPLFIPSGYEFHLKQGQTIDMQNGAFIMCRSVIKVSGTEEKPVKLTSTDNSTSAGLVVMQAPGRSRVEYMICDNLGEINSGIYHLTGSVTFYESDVDIYHSQFLNNRSEDGLNTVRSGVYLKNCTFRNTYQDAFDSDFCTGTFDSCHFESTGNDAFDVSTSVMRVKNCTFTNIHDKAISSGERSSVTVEGMYANNVQTGIGAKDSSTVVAKDVTVDGALIGLCSYQKKPEFGPSAITVDNYITKGAIDFTYLIEKQDTLIVDGEQWVASNKKKQALIIQRMINEEPIK